MKPIWPRIDLFRSSRTIKALNTMAACLTMAGCHPAATGEPSDQKMLSTVRAAPRATLAVITCRVGQSLVGISACLLGSSQTANGRLKVNSGSSMKQYSEVDIIALEHRAQGPAVSIPLDASFRIHARANGEPQRILRVEIRDGSNVIAADEVTEYGSVNIDSGRP